MFFALFVHCLQLHRFSRSQFLILSDIQLPSDGLTGTSSKFLFPRAGTIMTDIKHRRRRRWRRTGMINYVRSARNERITEKGNLFRDPAFLLPSKVRILSRQIRYRRGRRRRQRRLRFPFQFCAFFLFPQLLIKRSRVFIPGIIPPCVPLEYVNPLFRGACKIRIKFIVSRMYTLRPAADLHLIEHVP